MPPSSLSLMIVDDEKVTRESLARYIPWHTLAIQTVVVARNGSEALQLAQQSPPEILLTDVRMPKMDGLVLADHVRVLNPRCRVVFLSGYADKEYLKHAIKIQAVSYVEKPVDLDEVRKAVELAVSAWHREAAERKETQRLRETIRGALALMKEEIARGLVLGEEAARRIAAGDDALGSLGPDTPFTTAALRLCLAPGALTADKTRARESVLAACADLEPFSHRSSLAGATDDDTIALVVARRISPSRPGGIRPYEELLRRLAQRAGVPCAATIGIGSVTHGLTALPQSYVCAVETLRLGFYRGQNRVYFPSPAAAERLLPDPRHVSRLEVCLRAADLPGATDAVLAISAEARRQEPRDIDSVRDVFEQLYALAAGDPDTAGSTQPEDDQRVVRQCATLREMEDVVVSAIAGSRRDAGLPRRLREARRFLLAHYTDPDLTLQVMADHVGLSRTYLSSLYKTQTGRNIAEEITTLRIERAKELLRDPRARAHDVAVSVGYRDPNYFSALFRRRVGMSPTQYRDGP